MSGSNVWKLRLTTEGADQVVRDLRAAATESAAAARAYDALIKAQPGLATGAERAEQALRKNVDAMREMRGELNLLGSAAQGATSSLGAFGAALTSPAAAMTALGAASAASVVQIARLGDQYTETMNKLRAATGSVQAAGAVYAELVALSQQTGASISESAGAFGRFSIAARSVGATNGEVLQLVRTVQQAALIFGATTQETTAGVMQLGQALASGKLQGDELRSLMETMPDLMEALARELGVAMGQLRTMGAEGQLTSDRVFQALLRASKQINEEFDKLTPTMGVAFGKLGQAMVEFVGKLDQALGLSQAIARVATEAAGVVRGVSASMGPATPEAQIAASGRRQAELLAEIERLRNGAPVAGRRGSISRGLQETAAGGQDRAARIAELEASYLEEQRIAEQAQLRLTQITEEGALAQFNETQQANQRREEAQRTAATTTFNTVRDALDRERKLRSDHADRIKAIDEGLAANATTAEEATRLRALADRQLADGLKGLEEPTRAAARATQSRSEADREAAAIAREGEAVTRSVRTEAEKYADEVARLTGLLEAGAITQDTYNRAVAAADPAIRAASEASRRIEQENTRTTDRITSFFGDAFARAFEGTGNGFRSLMDSFKRAAISTFASIAAQAIIRPIIAPVVQGLGLGQLGGSGGGFNLGGLFGGGQAQAATPTGGGGLADAGSSFGTLRQAYNGLTSPGGLGAMFPGGSSFNTGFSALDGVLNTPAIQGAFPSEAAFQAIVDGTGATTGASLGQLLGPGLAIAGGAYGIYNGIQRGGPGGFTSAAGGAVSAATGIGMLGAAAGLLPALGALGPIGLGVGAALAIAGSLMPGARPSGMGQLARTNLNTGAQSTQGLAGNRYSAGNAAQAGSSVDNIVALAKEVGAKLGGASIGGDVAVGVTRGDIYLNINGQQTRAANTEQGAKDIAAAAGRMILNEFGAQGVLSRDYQGIVNASGGSLERLDENLRFYEEVYKAFEKTATEGDKVAQAVKAVEDRFGPMITKAAELGLSTDRLTEARAREADAARRAAEAAEASRRAEILMLKTSLNARMAAAKGVTDYESLLVIGQTQRAEAWGEELRGLEERLRALGVETADAAVQVEKLRSVQGAEYWRQRNDTMEGLDYGVQTRILRANGLDGSADWMDFERAAKQQIEELRKALAAMGVEAWIAAQKVAETEQAINAERQARIKAAQEQFTALGQNAASRILRATGRGTQAESFEFEIAAAKELAELPKLLTNLGISAAAAAVQIARTQEAINAERAARERARQDQIASLDQAASVRFLRAAGRGSEADSLAFEAAAAKELRDLPGILADLGVSAAAAAQQIALTREAINAERAARELARVDKIADVSADYEVRMLRAQGLDQDAEMLDFERRAARELRDLPKALADLGVTGWEAAEQLRMAEEVIGMERLEIRKRFAEEEKKLLESQGRGIREFIDAQRTNSGPGGVSSAEALAAAQTQFGTDLALARGGDADALARITGTADRLLQAGQKQFASNLDFQAIRSFVLSSLETLPATRSYDAMILEELRKLGGGVNVEVGITVMRTITEALNVLPAADMERLVQAQTVLRTVQQVMGRDLTTEERAGLVEGGAMLRQIEQIIGRDLTAAERAGMLVSARVERNVEQTLGRQLTAAERALLVEGGAVNRRVEQEIRPPAGATVILPGLIDREVDQTVRLPVGAPVLAPGIINREVRQAVETTETVLISRSIDDKLSALLNAQLGIAHEQLISDRAIGSEANAHTRQIMTDINNLWRTAVGVGYPGLLVRSNWSDGRAVVGFANGGVFDSPHTFAMGGGRVGMFGEAGPEAIMPLDRGPDGRLGVRANGGMSDALARQVDRMAREIAALRDQMMRLVRAGERTADAAEHTAETNARMVQRDVVVGRRARAA